MNIALLGYGKMGKEIEAIALERGHTIVAKINTANAHLAESELRKADAAIEFSTPHTVLANIRHCFKTKVPVVVGTTGWYEHFEAIKMECLIDNHALLYATNFSLGVNLFFKLNTYLASLMNKYPSYEVSMEEIHHIHKLDKPSGTAITLAEQIIGQIERKQRWSLTEDASDAVYIKDIREGEVPGTHSITYHSTVDDIEITHTAHNRKGFALGAVIAAEFIYNKKGIFTMQDLI